MTTSSQRPTDMQEHHKDLLAGALLALFCVATLLGGWLVLRLTVS